MMQLFNENDLVGRKIAHTVFYNGRAYIIFNDDTFVCFQATLCFDDLEVSIDTEFVISDINSYNIEILRKIGAITQVEYDKFYADEKEKNVAKRKEHELKILRELKQKYPEEIGG